eukprot:7371172-Prymnesium_polylepis.1
MHWNLRRTQRALQFFTQHLVFALEGAYRLQRGDASSLQLILQPRKGVGSQPRLERRPIVSLLHIHSQMAEGRCRRLLLRLGLDRRGRLGLGRRLLGRRDGRRDAQLLHQALTKASADRGMLNCLKRQPQDVQVSSHFERE